MTPKSSKLLFRGVGLVNLAVVLSGAYWLLMSVVRFVARPVVDAGEPYFNVAFFTIVAVNCGFLTFISVTAVQFLRLATAAVSRYSVMVVVLIAYGFLNGTLWIAGRGIGRSIAAATGVGNMGVAPFEFLFVVPYAYPILSALLLTVARKPLLVADPSP
jgi:hypothetical protein